MTSKNDITGDTIKTKVQSAAYAEGYDRIFSKKSSEAALEEMVRINEELGLYDLDFDGWMIDPPSGHQYGFPVRFSVKEHRTFRRCLLKHGYPMSDVNFALEHMRIWKDNDS